MVPLHVRVQKVICVSGCTIILDENGNIWYAGRLHLLQSHVTFTQFSDGIPFVDISYGYDNIAAIDIHGNLWAYGSNHGDSLGVEKRDLNQLILIKENAGFVTVNTYARATVCVDIRGEAWGCGLDIYRIFGWENNRPWEFKKIAEGTRVLDALVKDTKLYLLIEDGRVYMFEVLREMMEMYHVVEVIHEEIALGIIADQINIRHSSIIMLKDRENNVWTCDFSTVYLQNQKYNVYVSGSRREPFKIIPNIKADTLADQKLRPIGQRRFMTTKSARN